MHKIPVALLISVLVTPTGGFPQTQPTNEGRDGTIHVPTLQFPTGIMRQAVNGESVARARTHATASSQNRAQVMNRWENVAALVSGMRLRVGLTDGTRTAGTLQSVSPNQLVMEAEGGQGSVAWRRDQVTRVEQRSGPRVWSGAGWGALVGVLVGAIALGRIEPKDAVTNGVFFYHEIPVLATATAIGVGTGSAINAARQRWVVVYLNP